MRLRIIILGVFLLLGAGCEPFLLSLFPGYITDLAAYRDLAASFPSGDVERFHLAALNNGTKEVVFLVAYYYSGDRRLLIFDENLAPVKNGATARDFDETQDNFGSRCFVDLNNDFVSGGWRILASDFTPVVISGTDPPGPEGYGGAITTIANAYNAAIEQSSSNNVSFRCYDVGWNRSQTADQTFTIMDPAESASSSFDIIYSGRLKGAVVPALSVIPVNATVLVFHDHDDSGGNSGYAVLIDESVNISGGATPYLVGSGAPFHTIYLGGLGNEAHALPEGIVARGRDGTLRLFNWRNEVKAATRNYGSENLRIDYGAKGYYYIFDPNTLKLYKAVNWWVK